MKRLLTLTLAVCLSAAAVYGEVRGSWTASPNEKRSDELHLNMARRNAGWFNGNTFKLSELSGITAAQINAAAQTPVNFAIRGEAGVIDFEGVFRSGEGAGQFRFTPNTAVIATLRSMGLELDRDEKDEDELFSLALHDVSTDFIRAMRAEGFNEPLDEYVGMRAVGVTREYIRDMRQIFPRNRLDADDLTGMRAVGVTRQYIDAMRSAGMNVTDPGDVTGLKAVGVTPDYVQQMRAAGFKVEDEDDATSFKALGITPQYLREMRAVFPDVQSDDLTGMKAVGVTPEWVRDMRAGGFRIKDADEATSLKALGVTADYLRAMQSVFPDIESDDLTGMKAVGVTPEYVREMRAAGVKMDADDATSMKAVGVSVAFVKELAAAGYKNLTADQLTGMKAVGVDQKFIRDMSKYREKN